MNEVYTCICGYQNWTICDGFIICNDCGEQYTFRQLGISHTYLLESPKNFNARIKKENAK